MASNQTITAPKRKGSTMKKQILNGKLVIEALKATDNPSGTSTHCLKTYIAANYLIDIERVSRFLSKYLKKAVEDGTVMQIRGKGFFGSFKFATKPKDVRDVNPKEQKEVVDSKKQKIWKNVRAKQTRSNTRVGTKRSSQHLDVEEDPESKKAKTETEVNSEVATQEKVIKRVRFTHSTKGIDDPDVIQQQHDSRNITFKVIEAVGILGKAGACSLRSIKKYLEENCASTKNDISNINGIVKSAIISGVILGTKGTDLRGSFKLSWDFPC